MNGVTMNLPQVDRLVIIFVSSRQAEDLLKAMNEAKFYFTKFESSGVMFSDSTLGLLVGVNSARTSALYALIDQYCQPREEYVPVQFTPPAGFPTVSMIEARIGGALVYTVDVERFEQI